MIFGQVITAQSQMMEEKVNASRKLSGVQKKLRPQSAYDIF